MSARNNKIMQTFLPYADFELSAESLDRQRLGKQRVECKQILLALEKGSGGWYTHPAVKMWQGYETALAHYGRAVCLEWIRRGYKDSLLPFFEEYIKSNPLIVWPHWLGDPAFHASHRSNLVRKDPEWYRWNISNELPYVWPHGRLIRRSACI